MGLRTSSETEVPMQAREKATARARQRAPARARPPYDPVDVLARITGPAGRSERVRHVERVPARAARHADWPAWAPEEVVGGLARRGVERPWHHQVAAAELAHAGHHVVLATGTASGKSLAFQLPALAALTRDPRARVLYLAPTKALAADQLRVIRELAGDGFEGALSDPVWATTYDGDTSWEERRWARTHASYLLTNPDMLHRSLLPTHLRWARFFRGLRYVVIDECHHYRGVFGSHVAQVLRRLRRVAACHGADPTFILASATVTDPSVSAGRLTGLPVAEVTEDCSPAGELAFALWKPPQSPVPGENGAPTRRTATAESADLLADLTTEKVRTVAFVRSRRGAEAISLQARRHLFEVTPELANRVAAYRGGYLPEERRTLEAGLHSGELLGVAATNALELGIDVAGLDAVLLVGYPGTRASLWQQAGRAGRSGQGSLAVFVARDDPLDSYLVQHPEALFDSPVEATVLDPDNPYVLRPHLAAAAAEAPITEDRLADFGPGAREGVAGLEREGLLRRRRTGWFWTGRGRPCDLADIRSVGGAPVRVVEHGTGRLLGTVDHDSAPATVHEGAIYLHQGRSYAVDRLDLDATVAFVSAQPEALDYTTSAREVTDIRIVETDRTQAWGEARLSFGSVEVSNQVVSYLRRRVWTGEVLGETALDLPVRTLHTRSVWWTLSGDQLAAAGVDARDVAGSAHAVEHAAIGILPLFATCDRWDIGGVSTACHADTGQMTVFVHDGHPGGAGFSERGFEAAPEWLAATRQLLRACPCADGCPACVQSPKCGNGNSPLDKSGAVRLLDTLLAAVPQPR